MNVLTQHLLQKSYNNYVFIKNANEHPCLRRHKYKNTKKQIKYLSIQIFGLYHKIINIYTPQYNANRREELKFEIII